MRDHVVTLRVGDVDMPHWSDYSIEMDLLEPNASFRVELGRATIDEFKICKPDAETQIILDDTVLITGFIDERNLSISREGPALTVSGRCRAGRLVDESMPLGTVHGLQIKPFAERCVRPWFADVTLDNTLNRKHLRGVGAGIAKVVREPSSGLDAADRASLNATIAKGRAPGATAEQHANAISAQGIIQAFHTPSKSDTRVTPGQSRWQVLQNFLEGTGLLAWSTADGKSFFIGQPNYEQDAQYRFFIGKHGSDRESESNVLSFNLVDSVGDRYSKVICLGMGKGDANNTAEHVKFRSQVKNGPFADGTGADFPALHHKILIISESNIKSQGDCDERARREMGERDAHGQAIVLTVRGHGQGDDSGGFALYAPDTMAHVTAEEFGVDGLFLLTRIVFKENNDSETTELHLVPKGAQLKT